MFLLELWVLVMLEMEEGWMYGCHYAGLPPPASETGEAKVAKKMGMEGDAKGMAEDRASGYRGKGCECHHRDDRRSQNSRYVRC